jgi:hypothetical protein
MLNKLKQHWDTNERILVTYRERVIDSVEREDDVLGWFEQPSQFKFQIHGSNEIKSLANLFDENIHLQIVGYAGSGKTAIIKYLAVGAAKGQISNLPNLPIIIPLFSYQNETLLTAIQNQFAHYTESKIEKDLLIKLLLQGKIFILLDGIDECLQSEKLIKDIQDFSNRYPLSPIIITNRITSSPPIPNFRTAQIRPFEKEDIRLLTNKLCMKYNVDSQRLWLNLISNSALLSLAENPLQLQIIVKIYKQQNHKPLRINDFIESWVTNLLRSVPQSSRRDIFDFASRIAVYLEEGDHSDFSNDEIKNLLSDQLYDSRDINSALENSLDLLCKNGILDTDRSNKHYFVHKLLQEYFASKSVSSVDTEELLRSIEFDNEKTSRKLFNKCLFLDEKVDNDKLVFLLLNSDVPKAKSYIADLIIDNPTSTHTKRLALQYLLKNTQSDSWVFQTCDALASLNNYDIAEDCQIKLTEKNLGEWESTLSAYLLSMQGKSNNKILEALFHAARDKNASIRIRAYRALFATKSIAALAFIIDRMKVEQDDLAFEEILLGLENTPNLQEQIPTSSYSSMLSELEKRYILSQNANNHIFQTINKLSGRKIQNKGR